MRKTAKQAIQIHTSDGWKEVYARRIVSPGDIPDALLFVYPWGEGWRTAEGYSGCMTAESDTEAGAIEETYKEIAKGDSVRFWRIVDTRVANNGLSPAFKKQYKPHGRVFKAGDKVTATVTGIAKRDGYRMAVEVTQCDGSKVDLILSSKWNFADEVKR